MNSDSLRQLTLREIAAAIGGTLVGDGSVVVRELVHPLEAGGPEQLVAILDAGLLDSLERSPVRAAVVAEGLTVPEGTVDGWVVVGRPRHALGALLDLFERRPHAVPGIHPSAVVEAGAKIGDGASIGAFVYVGPDAEIGPGTVLLPHVTVGAGAKLGRDCLVHPGARLGERVVVGARVVIQHNASIGADGFSYATPQESSFEEARRTGSDTVARSNTGLRRIASIGTVILGDDVEVGALAAIDRSNIGATRIGEGTKIDNHVQIAHNCQIGRWCLFSGHVALAGSVRVGDRVVLAGGVGVADHVSVGDDAVVGAGSGVWKDVPARTIVLGYPAVPKSEALARELNMSRFGRIIRDVAELKRSVSTLMAARSGGRAVPATSDGN